MNAELTAAPISASTKGQVKRLRQQGRVPISVQHRGEATMHLETDAKPLDEFIRQHGESALLDLVLDGGTRHSTLVHGVQRDPISQRLLQVTLQRIEGDEQVKAQISLQFTGTPLTVSQHTAMLQHSLEQVEVRCKPSDLPEHILVDVSDLDLAQPLRVADLPAPPGVEIVTPADAVVASLSSLMRRVEEEAPAEAAAPAAAEEAPAAGGEAAGT